MSESSNRYTVRKLSDLAKTEPAAGYRIARVIYKGAEAKKLGKESQGAVVPAVSDALLNVVAAHPVGKQVLLSAIESAQEALIRARIATGAGSIGADEIGVTAVIAQLESTATSDRLTKESIAKWFGEFIAPIVSAAVIEKHASASAEKVAKVVDSYLVGFQVAAMRADGRCFQSEQVKTNVLAMLARLPEDHESMVVERLAEILPTIPVFDMESLG